MSFGFSAGDFIAFGKLVADITTCLNNTSGSKSDYQELVRELDLLQHALRHLDRLSCRSSSANLDSIKYAALSCRRPLEQLLEKLRKYEKNLGQRTTAGSFRSAADKVRWGFGRKDEVRKLQNYLNVHVGTINILLAEHGLEKMELASDKAEEDQIQVRDMLGQLRDVLMRIKDSILAQTIVVQCTNSMLTKLFEMIDGEFVTTWKFLADMVTKVCVSTQQTYAVVLEIKTSLLNTPDTRWSFFQAPFVVEDALGRKFPVPSEYNYELLDTIIRHKFQTGPGSLEVKAGNYEMVNTKDKNFVISADVLLLPGSAITMAILISKPILTLTDEICPIRRCGSNRTSEAPGGGRICCECNVWFDHSSKKRKSLQYLLNALESSTNDTSSQDQDLECAERLGKRRRICSHEEGEDIFKNVRMAAEEVFEGADPAVNSGAIQTDSLISLLDSPGPQSVEDVHAPPKVLEKPVLEFDDALAFVNRVKSTYAHKPRVYLQKLLGILQAYAIEEHPVALLRERVSELFAGDRSLLLDFFRFLPCPIPAISEEATKAPGIDDQQLTHDSATVDESIEILDNALRYLDKLYALCTESKPGAYTEFLKLRTDFKNGVMDELTLYQRISDLFAYDTVFLSEVSMFPRRLPNCPHLPSAGQQRHCTSDFREQNPILDDIFEFLEQLEESETYDKGGAYYKFLLIIRDAKSHVIDTLGFIERSSKLLATKSALLQKLSVFLPEGNISINQTTRSSGVEKGRSSRSSKRKKRAR